MQARLLLLFLIFSGCASDQLTRIPAGVGADHDFPITLQQGLPISIERYPNYELGAIELNDAGELRSIDQEEAVFGEVETLAKPRPDYGGGLCARVAPQRRP